MNDGDNGDNWPFRLLWLPNHHFSVYVFVFVFVFVFVWVCMCLCLVSHNDGKAIEWTTCALD